MGFMLIYAGLVFFFNPCINMFDILPDFIGCILISAGLKKLADTDDRFDTARRISNRLIPIYIAKSIIWFILFGSWKDGFLPATFICAVIEIIMMLGFCTSLFGAIEYTVNRQTTANNAAIHFSKMNTVTKFTVIFMVVKNVLAFLPVAFDLTKPSEYDFSYQIEPVKTLYDYKPYATLFFTVVVLALGIVYLSLNYTFFKGLSRDRLYNKNLAVMRKAKLDANPKIVPGRRFKTFFILMVVAAFLNLDLTVDSYNFTPDLIGYIIIFAAVLCVTKKLLPIAIQLGALSAISVASYVFKLRTDGGINKIMGYGTNTVERVLDVENGRAIVMAVALILAEMALYVLLFNTVYRASGKYFAQATCGEDSFSSALPTIVAGVVGALSCISYVSPYIKAYCHYCYSNDTLTSFYMEKLSRSWEIVQGISNVALIPAVLLLAASIFATSRKVNLRF